MVEALVLHLLSPLWRVKTCDHRQLPPHLFTFRDSFASYRIRFPLEVPRRRGILSPAFWKIGPAFDFFCATSSLLTTIIQQI